jgi:hypothetical protein
VVKSILVHSENIVKFDEFSPLGIEVDGKEAIPGVHYDVKAEPVYNGHEVSIRVYVVPLVAGVSVATLDFEARFDGKTWKAIEPKDEWMGNMNSESSVAASVVDIEPAKPGKITREKPGKFDSLSKLYDYLIASKFKVYLLHMTTNDDVNDMIVTWMGKDEHALLESIIGDSLHARAMKSETDPDGIEYRHVWISRKAKSLTSVTADVTSIESLKSVLADCDVEMEAAEPEESHGNWKMEVFLSREEFAWMERNVHVPGVKITGFVSTSPFAFTKDSSGILMHVTMAGRSLSKKFPTEGILRSFMHQIKGFDAGEINRRLEMPGNKGIYDIVDNDALFLDVDTVDDVLKRKIDTFCSKNGLRWKQENVGDSVTVTIAAK